jgi:hypothetical protein
MIDNMKIKKEKTSKEKIKKINKRKIIGLVFVFISIILSLANILSVKITGGVVGINVGSSFITILTIVFFVMSLLFLSKLEKGLAIATIVGGTAIGGLFHKINSENKQYVKDTQITAPSWKDEGRFQRAYRWDKILDKTEEKYGIPKGLLKGLAIRESYGDPLRLNTRKDGGAGLFMFSPGTAYAYGLKVSGNTGYTGVDKENGKRLKKLIAINKNNYEKMGKIDERFNIRKATDAAARYLKDDYNKYHSWNKALSAYNQGTPAPNAKDTEHVKHVREFQKYYNEHDKINHNSWLRRLIERI